MMAPHPTRPSRHSSVHLCAIRLSCPPTSAPRSAPFRAEWPPRHSLFVFAPDNLRVTRSLHRPSSRRKTPKIYGPKGESSDFRPFNDLNILCSPCPILAFAPLDVTTAARYHAALWQALYIIMHPVFILAGTINLDKF